MRRHLTYGIRRRLYNKRLARGKPRSARAMSRRLLSLALAFQPFVDLAIVAFADQRDEKQITVEPVHDPIFADVSAPVLEASQRFRVLRLGVFHELEKLGDHLPELLGWQVAEELERVMRQIQFFHAFAC